MAIGRHNTQQLGKYGSTTTPVASELSSLAVPKGIPSRNAAAVSLPCCMGIIWCDYCGVAGRNAAAGPPLIDDTARRRAAQAIDGGVSVGRKGLLDAAAPASVRLVVDEGPPSRV